MNDYLSLVTLSDVDVKEKKINVHAGNYLTKQAGGDLHESSSN